MGLEALLCMRDTYIGLWASIFIAPPPPIEITFACNCALLGYYAASSGNSLPTFFLKFITTENGTDRLSRNVGKELPLLAA